MRREHDFYPTPPGVIGAMMRELALYFEGERVWEPCSGDGRLAEAMADKWGCEVYTSDIQAGQDFFEVTEAPAERLVTNPPFKRIREFIDHAFDIGVREMALVCPERLWACEKGRKQFSRYGPELWANMSFREDYLGKGGSPDRALAVAYWNLDDPDPCRYEIWSR